MKSTKELIKKIKSKNRQDRDFWKDNDFKCPQIQYYLADLLREHGISYVEYIQQMNLERGYGYQILNGNRKPSREILIKTAILLQLNLEETQRLLKIGNRNILYPRVKKDAVAVFSIEKHLSLSEYQELSDAEQCEGGGVNIILSIAGKCADLLTNQQVLCAKLSLIVNDIGNCHFSLTKAGIQSFCKSWKAQFVMSFPMVTANLPPGMIRERENYEIKKNEPQISDGSPCADHAL